MDFITSLLSFILAIGILVTVHEYGHFWAARRMGVKVLRFSVGFGKPLLCRRGKDGVEYVLAAIPLGGYVKMLDEREAEVDPAERHLAFNNQGKAARAFIVVAGPLFNFIFAILAWWLVFTLGDAGVKPLVGYIAPQSVAEQAGFGYGDELVQIGEREVASWEQALYALLDAAVEGVDVPVQVRTEQGDRVALQLPGQALAQLVREDKDIFEQLGLEPMGLPAVIGDLVAGEAAERAGLQAGDRVLSSNGEPVRSWSDWVERIRANPDSPMDLLVERAGSELQIPLQVGVLERNGQRIGRVGAGVYLPEGHFERMRSLVRYDPITALWLSLEKTANLSLLTLRVMGKMLSGEASVHNLSGPISIAQTAGRTADYGFIPFLKFLALVSVSLAVLNLLPVPVLDGGHLVYILIEALRGKPLSDQALEQTQRLGLGLLFSLMILAFYVDIIRLLK
ncbi:RIP metalloprotease RseP [Magnetovirga frankeli]|uniref:RIP metalloprotease RseP n=1 Tax=Magnetovirga frankeli TaxID=947516 RepID=UPI001293ED6E|nr:RIP metalloprotease RseP [gamma proteobacterium SS-5]